MDVRLFQAEFDPGQAPSYECPEDPGDNFSIEWIVDAGYFSHLEKPQTAGDTIRRFSEEDSR